MTHGRYTTPNPGPDLQRSMNNSLFTVTAPANLLLMGEYAVTESGGLGIAMAIEPRATVTVGSAEAFSGESIMGGRPIPIDFEDKRELVPWIFTHMKERGLLDVERLSRLHILVDSSAFFDLWGRKLGLGSSASVTVALCASLLIASGARYEQAVECLPDLALEMHRGYQGGRGSGYDVLASCYGGVGEFCGGDRPTWNPIDLPWLPELYLYRGDQAIKSRDAIGSYDRWKKLAPGEYDAFFDESNQTVKQFSTADSWRAGKEIMRKACDIGIRLGKNIGIDASIPEKLMRTCNGIDLECKSLGAGNELVGCFAPGGLQLPAGLLKTGVSMRGVACM